MIIDEERRVKTHRVNHEQKENNWLKHDAVSLFYIIGAEVQTEWKGTNVPSQVLQDAYHTFPFPLWILLY